MNIYLIILLLPLLTGCGAAVRATLPDHTPTATKTSLQITQGVTISPTPLSTETPEPTSTSTPIHSPFTLDGLRVAYIMDGNIYVQDSGKLPVQLTHSGHDSRLKLSDDGERIVFFRGLPEEQYQVYTINTDGSQEQPLVTGSIMAGLSLGYDKSTEVATHYLIPGTHQMLFETQQFNPSPHRNAIANRDLLIVNMDTGQIKRLQNHWVGWIGYVSPDGKLMTDYQNIFGINGDIIRRNLIPDRPDWHYESRDFFWTQDSKKLILSAPIMGNADGTDQEPNYIWQYSVDGSPVVEIRLNPPPFGSFVTVSPDGNWIVYGHLYETDEKFPTGVYIGNLRDGSSHLAESEELYGYPDPFYWSPNSQHFIYASVVGNKLYLGNTQGDITPLHAGEFIGWVDNNRYIYKKDDLVIGEVGKEESLSVVELPAGIKYLTYVFVNPNTKK